LNYEPPYVVNGETFVDNERHQETTFRIIVITFIVFESIDLVLQVYLFAYSYMSLFHDWHDHIHVMHWCFYLIHASLYVVVSSSRCLVYALASRDFRQTLIDVIGCCILRRSINGRRPDDELLSYDVSFHGETVDISHELPLVVRQ